MREEAAKDQRNQAITTQASDRLPVTGAANTDEQLTRRGVDNTQASEKSQPNSEQSTQNKKPDPATKPSSPLTLSEEDLREVEKLRDRDREVRTHEAAHLAAAGRFAQGGAKFTTVRGPDGQSYAIGGSVGIDTGREATPEATIQKAEQIRRAALAPAEPSGQDRAVAAQAATLKLDAQAELAQESRESTATESRPSQANLATTRDVTKPKDSNDLSTPNVLSSKTTAATSCGICGGAHDTGGHLSANKTKLGIYAANSTPAAPQTLVSQIA